MKKKYYTFLLMLGVQNNSLLIIVITLIGTWRENKITLSDSNLQRKLVFLNNEKAAFQSVFFLYGTGTKVMLLHTPLLFSM